MGLRILSRHEESLRGAVVGPVPKPAPFQVPSLPPVRRYIPPVRYPNRPILRPPAVQWWKPGVGFLSMSRFLALSSGLASAAAIIFWPTRLGDAEFPAGLNAGMQWDDMTGTAEVMPLLDLLSDARPVQAPTPRIVRESPMGYIGSSRYRPMPINTPLAVSSPSEIIRDPSTFWREMELPGSVWLSPVFQPFIPSGIYGFWNYVARTEWRRVIVGYDQFGNPFYGYEPYTVWVPVWVDLSHVVYQAQVDTVTAARAGIDAILSNRDLTVGERMAALLNHPGRILLPGDIWQDLSPDLESARRALRFEMSAVADEYARIERVGKHWRLARARGRSEKIAKTADRKVQTLLGRLLFAYDLYTESVDVLEAVAQAVVLENVRGEQITADEAWGYFLLLVEEEGFGEAIRQFGGIRRVVEANPFRIAYNLIQNEIEDRIYGLGPPAARGPIGEVNQALGVLHDLGVGEGGFVGLHADAKKKLAQRFKQLTDKLELALHEGPWWK